MRAILVSVDYSDILAITLPHNRSHFKDVTVVTSTADAANVKPIVDACAAQMLVTDLFYTDGAAFNKWAALEWALDVVGRGKAPGDDGWLCLMDADVLWPYANPWEGFREVIETDISPDLPKGTLLGAFGGQFFNVRPGELCSPLRRMFYPAPGLAIPPDSQWKKLDLHRNVGEWVGFTQIFHCDDPVLGDPPWHEIWFKHAGAADSFFQAKWPHEKKIRPPWEVLHIGPAGANWFGRSSLYLDGTEHPQAKERAKQAKDIWAVRYRRKAAGLDPFAEERLSAQETKNPASARAETG